MYDCENIALLRFVMSAITIRIRCEFCDFGTFGPFGNDDTEDF